MKIILIQDVGGVGRKGEVKEVSDGYARNFLIPNKKAIFGSDVAVKNALNKKNVEKVEKEIQENLAKKWLEMLKNTKIEMTKKANEKGHLFEQVHKEEIVGVLKVQTKIDLNPEFIKIEKPIKEIGDHKVSVEIGGTKAEVILHLQSS
ncbi:MAG: 50S ribosomal protein L9 [Patescibacteria group bacterium]